MRRLIKFLQSYFLHLWTLSPPFYINHRKNPVCYPASYLFRLVINVQEKRTSSLYKIITHNYIHNSSLWHIPPPRPVVLGIWSGFAQILLIVMTRLAEQKKLPKKKGKRRRIRRNGIRAAVHNLAKESNLKFFNRSSYLWAVVGADMTVMKY